MAVNITGAFNMTRSALQLMGKGARIINLASTFAHVGSPGQVAYSTTKGAILAFTRSLRPRYGAPGHPGQFHLARRNCDRSLD